MRQHKQTDAAVQALLAKADRQRAQIKPWQDLLAAFDAKQWDLISSKLKVRLKNLQGVRQGHEALAKIPDVELKMLLSREDEIIALLELPNEGRKLLKRLEAEHAALRNKISEKQRSG